MDNNILIIILAGGALYYFYGNELRHMFNRAGEPTGVYTGNSPLQETNIKDKDGKNIYMRDIGDNINPQTGLPSKWLWTNDIYGFKDILAPQRPPPDYAPVQPKTWSKY